MKRLTEPELMEDETQVLAYANANFSVAHDHFITLIKGQLVAERMPETVLELGCGPGDITQRFAHAFPHCVIDAVDGSQPMLDSAQNMLPQHLRQRINFYRLLLRQHSFQNRATTWFLVIVFCIICTTLIHYGRALNRSFAPKEGSLLWI